MLPLVPAVAPPTMGPSLWASTIPMKVSAALTARPSVRNTTWSMNGAVGATFQSEATNVIPSRSGRAGFEIDVADAGCALGPARWSVLDGSQARLYQRHVDVVGLTGALDRGSPPAALRPRAQPAQRALPPELLGRGRYRGCGRGDRLRGRHAVDRGHDIARREIAV